MFDWSQAWAPKGLMLAVLALLAAIGSRPCAALTVEDIDRRLAEVEKSYSDDNAKQQLLQLYQKARGFAEAQTASQAAAVKFAKSLSTGPRSLRETQQEYNALTKAPPESQVTAAERNLPLAELERLYEAAVTQRTSLENELKSLELRDRNLSGRPVAILQEKSKAAARINELETQLGSGTVAAGDDLARAKRDVAEAELGAKQGELAQLDQEMLSQSIRSELLAAKRKLAEARYTAAAARADELAQLLLQRREAEIKNVQQEAERAQADASGSDATTQQLAQENANLSQELSAVIAGQARTAQERSEFAERRRRLEEDFSRAQQRLKLAGNSSSLGRILVDQRRRLTPLRTLTQQSKHSGNVVSQIGARRIEIDEQTRLLVEGQRTVSSLLAARTDLTDPVTRTELEPVVGRLLNDQRELLANLDDNYASYLRALDASEFELQQLIASTEAFSSYLDERLLWLPNAPAIGVQFFRDMWYAAAWPLRPANWRALGGDVWAGIATSWGRMLVLILAVAATIRARPRLLGMLEKLAREVRDTATDRLRYTVFALLITTALALPWPTVMWVCAEVLRVNFEAAEFSLAIAQGLRAAAMLTLAGLWLDELFSVNGVCRAHFGWPEAPVEAFRRRLVRLSLIFVPTYAIAAMFEAQSNPAFQYSIGRLSFMLAMLGMSWFMHWVLRQDGVLHNQLLLRQPTSWLTRLRVVWANAASIAPFVLVVLSGLGYYYTARELSHYYLMTIGLLVTASIGHSLAIRWLLVAEQRLAMKRMREAMAAQTANPTDPNVVTATEHPIDFAKINAQTRLILSNVIGWSVAFGLYWVWKDVLPALTIFQSVQLWQIQITDASGSPHLQPITIASVALAGIITGVTVIASRNVPGVLEIALLQRLNLHHGSRYAITTLAQYLIVAIGLSIAIGRLGVRWSQIQWLIAALGVGLGFGLQEIFANFVSGLILLFERPIRVGDAVTIGELSGKVNRIQIRATTIVDWDNKEIVVPNKTFITERFINWTLTDQMTRVVITVVVAYGTDTDQALGILLNAAANNRRVLADPKPRAVFVGFGDTGLNLELDVFVLELGDRVGVLHALNTAIYKAFTLHCIEIPFPRRDLNPRKTSAGSGPTQDPA